MDGSPSRKHGRWKLGVALCVFVLLAVLAWQGCSTAEAPADAPASDSFDPDAAARIEARRVRRLRAAADRDDPPVPSEAAGDPASTSDVEVDSGGSDLVVRVQTADGQPVSHGTALLLPVDSASAVDWGHSDVERAEVGARGIARFSQLSKSSYWLAVESGQRGALLRVVETVGKTDTTVVVRDGRPLSGKIVWEDGAAVTTATLSIQFFVARDDHDHPRVIPGYVNQLGHFSLPRIPNSALRSLSIRAVAPDRSDESQLIAVRRTWPFEELPQNGFLTVTMTERFGLGRVVDASGAPVTDVYLSGERGRGTYARVDGQGRFRINLAAAPLSEIWVHGKERIGAQAFPFGHAAHTSNASLANEVVLGDVRLAKEYRVSGQVRDPDGMAVPARTVGLFRGDIKLPALKRVCDLDGKFEFEQVPPGEYRLRVLRRHRDGEKPSVTEETVVVSGDREVVLVTRPDPDAVELVLRFAFPPDTVRKRVQGMVWVKAPEGKPGGGVHGFDLHPTDHTASVYLSQPGRFSLTIQLWPFVSVEMKDVDVSRGTPRVLDVQFERRPKAK